MEQAMGILLRHGYAILFAVVLAEQLGLPIPAVPMLLAMGALAGSGRFSFLAAVLVAVSASLVSDILWYELGRHRGRSVLNVVCRVSLEPDFCVRRTENTFAHYGPGMLLFAKFVPGLNITAPPLVGMFRMPSAQFLMWDSVGALLWSATFSAAGYVFRKQLERAGALAMRLGAASGCSVGSRILVVYLLEVRPAPPVSPEPSYRAHYA